MSARSVRASVDSLRDSVPSSWRSFDMPTHLRHVDGTFTNTRNQSLSYLALFPPHKTPVRGVVVYLHGLGEHARRFYHVYEQLCESGFGVLAYDLLGHGESDSGHHGMRAHAEKFRYFVDDTNSFIAFAKQNVVPPMLQGPSAQYCPAAPFNVPPLILLGASYGTLVALHTVLSEQHTFAAVVLASPTVMVEWRPLLRLQALVARPLSALLPTKRIVPAVKGELLCRDPSFLADYYNDPLTVSDHMTMRMGEQSLRACLALQREPRVADATSAFCAVPILLLVGSMDKVASVPSAITFYERLGTHDKQLEVLVGMFHTLFDDPEKDEVFDVLLDWLVKRFRSLKGDGTGEAQLQKDRSDQVDLDDGVPLLSRASLETHGRRPPRRDAHTASSSVRSSSNVSDARGSILSP